MRARHLGVAAAVGCALVVLLAPGGAAHALPADTELWPEEMEGEEVEVEVEDRSCGLDPGCRAEQSMREILAEAISDAFSQGVQFAASGLILSPPLPPQVRESWALVLGITNTVFVLIVTVAGILLMANQTVQSSYTARDLVARVALAWLAANLSWLIIVETTRAADALSWAIAGEASDAEAIARAILGAVTNPVGSGLVVLLVLAILASFGFILTFVVVVRAMLLMLITVAAPLALACHALPGLDGLARLWWRTLGGLLLMQVAHAVVVMLTARLFLDTMAGGLMSLMMLLAAMYVMFRVPFWIFRRVMSFQPTSSPPVRAAITVASLLVFRRALRRLPVKGRP
jgi:hypothetical protein